MCKVLEVSSSSYYHWKRSPKSLREQKKQELKQVVKDVYFEFKQRYGSPRISAELINTAFSSMSSVPLIYNTNNDAIRSGNPGGSMIDKVLPDTGLIQRLSYNAGHIKFNSWQYCGEHDDFSYYDAISEFKQTTAHEIGHEILLECYDVIYSWQHKGSSYYLPQNIKPTPDTSVVKKTIEDMKHLNLMD